MSIKDISLTAVMMALVVVVTVFVSIPAGNIGYVNLGDSVILVLACFLSPHMIFLIGGIGSAVADLALGFSQYAIISLIAKGLEGWLVAGLINKNKMSQLPIFLAGISVMAVGYAGFDLLLFKNWGIFLDSLLLNYMQGLIALACALLILPLVRGRVLRRQDGGQ